jgi:hypothetical protein
MLGRLGIKSQILRIAHPQNQRVSAQAAGKRRISRATTTTAFLIDGVDPAT